MNELRKNHFPECIPEVCRVCRARCDASFRPRHDFANDADYAEAPEHCPERYLAYFSGEET